MNLRLVCKQLAIVAMLIGGMMAFSLPWAWYALGHRTEEKYLDLVEFETRGFVALCISIVISAGVGSLLWWIGKSAKGSFYRKEAMAVVGLSWVLATLLGAVPYLLSHSHSRSSVRLFENDVVQVYGYDYDGDETLLSDQVRLLKLLLEKGARGATEAELTGRAGDPTSANANSPDAPEQLRLLAQRDERWRKALIFPEDNVGPADRRGNYRIRWEPMNLADALFESQSGFSTTGATVISDLEDPHLVPRCILFWRSSTHFLGGLGIIVLFVAILGQGSAGKALMRAEMPGPSKEGSQTRMQHTALTFAIIYAALNIILTIILLIEGMSLYDALCHAMGTMATGGFSTYNGSLGQFQQISSVNAALIEYTVIIFMIIAGTNFTLLYFVTIWRLKNLVTDVELRVYIGILLLATVTVVGFGSFHGDFRDSKTQQTELDHAGDAVRHSLFQVTSIMTTTGYGTHDFNAWNSFGRGLLFLLMFIGGCAGSTGGGMKVIRHILFHKILWLEAETSFRPSVVRPLRLGGKPVDDPGLRHNILVYFGLILFIFIISWMLLLTFETDRTWGGDNAAAHKLIDSATAVAATLNNIGPGLGTVGATKNYAFFSPPAKLLFTVLMMIGRLEIFPIIVLFVPRFWRARP